MFVTWIVNRSENSQLEKFREKVRKQHEILTRENEKLARKLEQVLRAQGANSNIITKQTTEFVIDEQVKTLPKIEKQTNGSSPNAAPETHATINVVVTPSSPRKTSPKKNTNSNSSFERVDPSETIE